MAQLRFYLETAVSEHVIKTVKNGGETTGFNIGYEMVDLAMSKIRADFEHKSTKIFDNQSR